MEVDLLWLDRECSASALSQLAKTGFITRAEVKWMRETRKARMDASYRKRIEDELRSAARSLRRLKSPKAQVIRIIKAAFANY